MHNTKVHTTQSIEQFKQQTDKALRQHIAALIARENRKLIKSFKKSTTTEAAKLSK